MTSLRNRITTWGEIQALYIPAVPLLRAAQDQEQSSNSPETPIYSLNLWLPSAIGQRAPCNPSLQEIEWELRKAQANDALTTIRQHLRIESFLLKRKKDWARGVKANTRSQTIIDHNRVKRELAVKKYCAAYSALDSLGESLMQPPEWRIALRPLSENDVRSLPVDGLGEGYTTLSWIWMTSGVMGEGSNELGLNDGMSVIEIIQCEADLFTPALRIQWCRARARKMRWCEEVELLLEEMRRVQQFLEWQAKWWVSIQEAKQRVSMDDIFHEGMTAYALRQAHIRVKLKEKFAMLWRQVGEWAEAGKVTGKGAGKDENEHGGDDVEGNEEDDDGEADGNGDQA
jgi:hypothetical protein